MSDVAARAARLVERVIFIVRVRQGPHFHFHTIVLDRVLHSW